MSGVAGPAGLVGGLVVYFVEGVVEVAGVGEAELVSDGFDGQVGL